jgi:autotransporter translocation and assembly factor TamB
MASRQHLPARMKSSLHVDNCAHHVARDFIFLMQIMALFDGRLSDHQSKDRRVQDRQPRRSGRDASEASDGDSTIPLPVFVFIIQRKLRRIWRSTRRL